MIPRFGEPIYECMDGGQICLSSFWALLMEYGRVASRLKVVWKIRLKMITFWPKALTWYLTFFAP